MGYLDKKHFRQSMEALEKDFDGESGKALYGLMLNLLDLQPENSIKKYLNREKPYVEETISGSALIENPDDLYDVLTIYEHPEDDSAWYIAENLFPLRLRDFPEKAMDIYRFICDFTDRAIELIRTSEQLNDVQKNKYIGQLTVLKNEIEKDRKNDTI